MGAGEVAHFEVRAVQGREPEVGADEAAPVEPGLGVYGSRSQVQAIENQFVFAAGSRRCENTACFLMVHGRRLAVHVTRVQRSQPI